jgi:hypothetical protein
MTGDQAFGQVFKWNAVDQIGLMRQRGVGAEPTRDAIAFGSGV